MIISKEEIAKIKKIKNLIGEEAIINCKIKGNQFYLTNINEGKFFQLNLSIENENNEELTFKIEMGELLKLTSTFTKKADIEILAKNNSLIFKGIQNKEEVEVKVKIEAIDRINILNIVNGTNIDVINFLSALIAAYRLSKKMESINVESMTKVAITPGKIRLFSNSNSEILNSEFDFNSNISASCYLEREKIRFLYESIQESKSFDLTIAYKGGIFIKSGYITVFVKASTAPGLDLESMLQNLENRLNFQKINATIDEKAILKRDTSERIAYLNNDSLTSDDINNVFSDISKIEQGYSDKRISELLKINSIEINEIYCGSNGILRLQNDFLKYYLMPQKKTN